MRWVTMYISRLEKQVDMEYAMAVYRGLVVSCLDDYPATKKPSQRRRKQIFMAIKRIKETPSLATTSTVHSTDLTLFSEDA